MGLVNFNLEEVGNVFTSIREAITGDKIKDPVEMAKIDLQLQTLEQASKNGQIAINKVEAAHKNLFVAGWRPFIGWTAGVGLAYTYVFQPLMWWLIKIYVVFSGIILSAEQLEALRPVTLDTALLFNLILAMLGMAGMRTYEKLKQVAREK